MATFKAKRGKNNFILAEGTSGSNKIDRSNDKANIVSNMKGEQAPIRLVKSKNSMEPDKIYILTEYAPELRKTDALFDKYYYVTPEEFAKKMEKKGYVSEDGKVYHNKSLKTQKEISNEEYEESMKRYKKEYDEAQKNAITAQNELRYMERQYQAEARKIDQGVGEARKVKGVIVDPMVADAKKKAAAAAVVAAPGLAVRLDNISNKLNIEKQSTSRKEEAERKIDAKELVNKGMPLVEERKKKEIPFEEWKKSKKENGEEYTEDEYNKFIKNDSEKDIKNALREMSGSDVKKLLKESYTPKFESLLYKEIKDANKIEEGYKLDKPEKQKIISELKEKYPNADVEKVMVGKSGGYIKASDFEEYEKLKNKDSKQQSRLETLVRLDSEKAVKEDMKKRGIEDPEDIAKKYDFVQKAYLDEMKEEIKKKYPKVEESEIPPITEDDVNKLYNYYNVKKYQKGVLIESKILNEKKKELENIENEKGLHEVAIITLDAFKSDKSFETKEEIYKEALKFSFSVKDREAIEKEYNKIKKETNKEEIKTSEESKPAKYLEIVKKYKENQKNILENKGEENKVEEKKNA